jgi:hypothetical protein
MNREAILQARAKHWTSNGDTPQNCWPVLYTSRACFRGNDVTQGTRLRWWIPSLLLLVAIQATAQSTYRQVVIQNGSHPAVRSAAQVIIHKLGMSGDALKTVAHLSLPRRGQIVLLSAPGSRVELEWLGPKGKDLRNDGYMVVFRNGGALIYGARPRSLLYAAGDWRLWKDQSAGTLVQEPDFAIRTGEYDANRPVAEYVAELGVNVLIGKPNDAVVTLKDSLPEVYRQLSSEQQSHLDSAKAERAKRHQELARECRDADVELYAFLFGSDFELWSNALYQAVLKAYPSVKGTPGPASFEKARLCPSDPMTWKVIRAYVQDFMEQSFADGLYATFWDKYGLDCQDDRCVRNGLSKFPNQLYEAVREYYEVLRPMGKKLVVRTWSSGVPHWLGPEFVHAPGYGHFGGSGIQLWSRVIQELPSEIALQTKVYDSDCQPDSRFSPWLGQAGPHIEIAEYQISGQTVGRFYFPASSVEYNAATMRRVHELLGAKGGVNIFPGGTQQPGYSLLDDIANSVNIYAWRRLSWHVNADLAQVWREWAVPIYGEQAAPHIINALRLSEEAVNRTFSTLAMGSSTNSDFARTIERRETLLKYTNRYDLPEYAKALEPTRENIQRVVEEKAECLRKIAEMFSELEQARPFLRKEQYEELATRFDWLRQFSSASAHLDESLWRYRYLRYLASMLTTDPEQLKYIAQNYDSVKEEQKTLFRFDPAQKFSCYRTPLGQLRNAPSLGSPVPLMKELYEQSKTLIESIVGPDYLPAEVRR